MSDQPLSALAGLRLPPEDPPTTAAKTAAPEASKAEVARLHFLNADAIARTVTLEYPFQMGGEEVRSITARRLTVAETGAVIERVGPDKLDVYDFYAEMTGLPAPILLGLIDDDGERVMNACAPFLPRFMRVFLSEPTQDAGGVTPSS